MGVRQPGMHRPHRYLDREAEHEGEENQHLLGQAERQFVEIENFETTGLVVHVDQGDQHEHRPQKCVQEELEGGVDPARPSPDPDDQEHRDQHRFEEDVEQNGVQRGEHTDHQAFHDQEGSHVLGNPILHHLPAGDHHQQGHERGEQDQRHGEPIHAQVIIGIEGRNPGYEFLKLHRRCRGVERRVQGDTNQQAQDCHRQRQRLGAPGVFIAHEQHRDAAQNREPDDKTQQRQFRQHGFSSSRLAGDEPGQQDQQTDDHGKRIGI